MLPCYKWCRVPAISQEVSDHTPLSILLGFLSRVRDGAGRLSPGYYEVESCLPRLHLPFLAIGRTISLFVCSSCGVGRFKMYMRGRWGCPVSPSLFALIMDPIAITLPKSWWWGHLRWEASINVQLSVLLTFLLFFCQTLALLWEQFSKCFIILPSTLILRVIGLRPVFFPID